MIAYVVGTLDTKGPELAHVAGLLRAAGVSVRVVDVSTGPSEGGDVTAASSMERLPTETALTAQTRAFKTRLRGTAS